MIARANGWIDTTENVETYKLGSLEKATIFHSAARWFFENLRKIVDLIINYDIDKIYYKTEGRIRVSETNVEATDFASDHKLVHTRLQIKS